MAKIKKILFVATIILLFIGIFSSVIVGTQVAENIMSFSDKLDINTKVDAYMSYLIILLTPLTIFSIHVIAIVVLWIVYGLLCLIHDILQEKKEIIQDDFVDEKY